MIFMSNSGGGAGGVETICAFVFRSHSHQHPTHPPLRSRQACIESSLKIAQLLVAKGANVNAIDNDWWTPLHAAAACDHWRIVNLLISSGANTDVVNVDGDLPLEIAGKQKQATIAFKRSLGGWPCWPSLCVAQLVTMSRSRRVLCFR